MPFTPSTSPTLARPESQSTTRGHLNAFGALPTAFSSASSLCAPAASPPLGCAETNVPSDALGRYERIVRSWSGVGGPSTTSRSNLSGPEEDEGG